MKNANSISEAEENMTKQKTSYVHDVPRKTKQFGEE
jgi:hypothetical protein